MIIYIFLLAFIYETFERKRITGIIRQEKEASIEHDSVTEFRILQSSSVPITNWIKKVIIFLEDLGNLGE